jgi:hypothetical protein
MKCNRGLIANGQLRMKCSTIGKEQLTKNAKHCISFVGGARAKILRATQRLGAGN